MLKVEYQHDGASLVMDPGNSLIKFKLIGVNKTMIIFRRAEIKEVSEKQPENDQAY